MSDWLWIHASLSQPWGKNIASVLLVCSRNYEVDGEIDLKGLVPVDCGIMNSLYALYRTFQGGINTIVFDDQYIRLPSYVRFMLASLIYVKYCVFQGFISGYISYNFKIYSWRTDHSCTAMLFATCRWYFYISQEIFVLQRLLNGAEQGHLDAVERALAEGANIDVRVSPHASFPLDSSDDNDHIPVIVKFWVKVLILNVGTKCNGENGFIHSILGC